MSSSTGHKIKARDNPRDVFITPRELAKVHIDYIDAKEDDVWFDPCRFNENGSYYSQFPTEKKIWCEILEGEDFFTECEHNWKKLFPPNKTGDPSIIICCNPPYSILDDWFKECILWNPRVCSFLIGVNNLTAKRIEMFEKAGYGLTKLKMLKVWEWYGMSYIVVFEKGGKSIMDIDRKVYR